jgi:glycosyltransferase involved in cell wall biosynthesis
VAVLWDSLSGFLHASLRALVESGVDVVVFRRDVQDEAPFDADSITSGLRSYAWTGEPDVAAIEAELEAFDPDAVLVCSWHIGGYRRIARRLKGRTLRIMSLSNQWFARPKQIGGVVLSSFVVRPTCDAAFICDERQAVFAGKLGIPAERLIWGLNSCDHDLFSAVARERGDELPPKAFVFVGRLVHAKAVDVLAAGYAAYRSSVADPWRLLVAGTGPQADLLDGIEGVEMLGFVQPADLPSVLARAGCLVLPSRFEPWAVVIHEATAAGLPVLCTRACGASNRLVLDGFNGAVMTAGDVGALTGGLRRIHDATDDERRAMGAGSELLSLQYTPERWAQNLMRRIPELRAEVGLAAAPWAQASRGARATSAAAGPGVLKSARST